MTTTRVRSLVSLTTAMTITLVLGACVRTASRGSVDAPTNVERPALSIQFNNDANEYVRVYIINGQREWPLGRVEAGAIATLRIPEESFTGTSRFVQLAVIKGGPMTLRAGRDPRATFAMAQPPSGLMAQQWRFAEGQLTPWRAR